MFNIDEINHAYREDQKNKKFCDEVMKKTTEGQSLEEAIKSSGDCEYKNNFKSMDKVNKLIETGAISMSDVEEYLETKGKEIVDSAYLEELENIKLNHPG